MIQPNHVKVFVRMNLIGKNVLILPKKWDYEEENLIKVQADVTQKKHVNLFVQILKIIKSVRNILSQVVKTFRDQAVVIVNHPVGHIVKATLKNVGMEETKRLNIIPRKCVVKLQVARG